MNRLPGAPQVVPGIVVKMTRVFQHSAGPRVILEEYAAIELCGHSQPDRFTRQLDNAQPVERPNV